MIKASEIADALSAIDAAIRFIADSDFNTPGRIYVRDMLIKSRVDLDFSLRGIKMEVNHEQ